MDWLVNLAESFTNIFNEGGNIFIDLVAGFIPMILVLLTLLNAITRFVGEKRIEAFTRFLSRNVFLAYTVLPLVSWFFLCNPMVYSAAKFLPQRARAGYIDAVATTNGPMLSLFPHVNPAEIFIWLGIANGVQKLGLATVPLAIRFFIAGWILAVIRALVTERLWVYFAKKDGIEID